MSDNQQDKLKDHSYDGIQEYDNRLPNWWVATFVITVLFGVGYWLYYHVTQTGPTLQQEYDQVAAVAKAAQAEQAKTEAPFDEAVVAELVKKPDVLASAKTVFTTNCAACHGNEGGGVIGPNLTDDHWIHGGKVQDIYHTIETGVAAKGMPAWHGVLSSEQVRGLTAYIVSLRGSNPANAKAPEGEKQ